MNIKLELPEVMDLKPRIAVIGIGGAGCNAINNMIATGLEGVEFIAANTDAQALAASSAEHCIQLGVDLTEGLGAGAKPEIGREAAEEAIDEIRARIEGCHMVFLAAGMGGGTGTGAISVVARVAREMDILTIAIVSKPFQFEGSRRMRTAETGIAELRDAVDTLIVIPNQNLFRVANEKTTFAEAFILADQVLYSGIACIVDLIVKDGLINLDFADVKAVMKGMGSAMMGTGEATGDGRATLAAEAAITNPLLDEISLRGARGLLVSIIGGSNLTLFEVDEAASRVKQEADADANIIVGASFEDDMDDKIRVSIVASGLESGAVAAPSNSPSAQSTTYRRGEAAGYAAPQITTPGATQERGNASDAVSPRLFQRTPAAQATAGNDRPPEKDSKVTTAADSIVEDGQDAQSDTDKGVEAKVDQAARASMSQPVGEPPNLPAGNVPVGEHEADPYMGNTSVDEFARALSEVMGTVGDDGHSSTQAAGSAEDYRLPWQSSDGVVIEDGLTTSLSPAPPPLPAGAPPLTDHAPREFRPQPPAELPRRVPDITEFPEVAQREYHSKTADEDNVQGGGMHGLLRRLATFGRHGSSSSDSPVSDSHDEGSRRSETHENNIEADRNATYPARRFSGGNSQ